MSSGGRFSLVKCHRGGCQRGDESRDGWYKWQIQGKWVQRKNNSVDEDSLHWTSALYVPLICWLSVCLPFLHSHIMCLLFMLVSLLLYLAHAVPVFLSALLETLTLYCCYYLVEFNNVSLVVDSSYVLSIFMHIIKYSDAKKYPRVLAFKWLFLQWISYNSSNRRYLIKWITPI